MIIIGERLNSTRISIKAAIDKKDATFLTEEAKRQIQAGASFIDINCATSMEEEADDAIWLISNVQKALNCNICIDSPNPSIIEKIVGVCKGRTFINSISAESQRLKDLLPIIKKNNSYAVALTMDDSGMPYDTETRILLAEKIISAARKAGISKESIYIDPLVKPISTEPQQAQHYLESIKILKQKGVKTVGGLSNVSFGLPKRGLINAVFLKLAIENGIDAVIIDPTQNLIKMVLENKELPEEQFALARNAILGKDMHAIEYIRAFRKGILG